MISQDIHSIGKVFLTINNEDGSSANIAVNNKVLLTGQNALAKMLANDYDGTFSFYIARVLFGNSGTVGGAPLLVDGSRTALFGAVTLAKPVIASIDPNYQNQVTFTTTVAFSELIGQVINEMALEMANGDLFSLVTFGDITKSSSMELIFNWKISFV